MQYPVKSGPVQNDAAPFSVEMAQGTTAIPCGQPRVPFKTQHLTPISQTTHVPATFSMEMSAGHRLDSPRIYLGPRIPLPLYDPTLPSAPASVEMFAGIQGVRYPTPKIHLGVKIPLPIYPLDEPSSREMQGVTFPTPRIFLGPRIALPIGNENHTSAAFSHEMAQGVIPRKQPRLPFKTQHLDPISQLTHVPAPFGIEMSIGIQGVTYPVPRVHYGIRIPLPFYPLDEPSSREMQGVNFPTPRIFLGPRIPLPVGNENHVNAAFSIEMAAGTQGVRYPAPRIQYGIRIPQPIGNENQVNAAFSPEMISGAQGIVYPFPRLMFGVRIPLPLSQTSPVAATFSTEMVAGVTAILPRIYLPRQLGIAGVPTVDIFGIEMVRGWMPDSPRILLGPRIGLPLSQTTHVAASPSMEMYTGVQGIIYPFPRLHLGIKIPQPVSQTTQVDSPFSNEMTSGAQGISFPSPRIHLGTRIPLPISETSPTAAPFSVEMISGAQGVGFPTPRILLGKRIGLPISQETHVQAPHSPEMFTGVTVPSPRLTKIEQFNIIFDATIQLPFLIEVVLGRNKPPIYFKFTEPISQLTHVQAAPSPEMFFGAQGIAFPAPRVHYGIRIPQPPMDFVTIRFTLPDVYDSSTLAVIRDKSTLAVIAERSTRAVDLNATGIVDSTSTGIVDLLTTRKP